MSNVQQGSTTEYIQQGPAVGFKPNVMSEFYKETEDRKAYERRCEALRLAIMAQGNAIPATMTLVERAKVFLRFLSGETDIP